MKATVFSRQAAVLCAALLPLLMLGCTASKEPTGSGDGLGLDHTSDQGRLFQGKNIMRFGLGGTKQLVLTFDDGPTADVTDAILDVLKDEGVQGTFFIQGSNVTENKTYLLHRMYLEGHVVANHTLKHPNLHKKSNSGAFAEIAATHQLIAAYMRPAHRRYFRAPYGNWVSGHKDRLNNDRELMRYIGPIYWDIGGAMQYRNGSMIGAADWACWSKGISASKCARGYVAEAKTKRGGIVLMHDVNSRTATLLRLFIQEMKAAGYSFITLDDVRELDKYEYEVLL